MFVKLYFDILANINQIEIALFSNVLDVMFLLLYVENNKLEMILVILDDNLLYSTFCFRNNNYLKS